jgi:aconitase B
MEKNIDNWIKNGVFFALFVSLLVWTMNENKAREAQYQQTIQTVTDANSKYADIIKIDLAEIKSRIGR